MTELTEIHKRMVRDVFLHTEILLNEGEREIFEYDIQAFMFLFFRNYLKSYDYHAGREKHKKVDCVLYKNDDPVVFYEIKTYFKARERIKRKHFIDDLTKIAKLLKDYPGTKGYFFTSGLTKRYQSDTAKTMSFINAHIQNDRTWFRVDLNEGLNVRVRPSVKETRGISNTLSWEVCYNKRLHADAQTCALFVGFAALHNTTKSSPVWALVSRALCLSHVWTKI